MDDERTCANCELYLGDEVGTERPEKNEPEQDIEFVHDDREPTLIPSQEDDVSSRFDPPPPQS
jgi:hypothetical protein